MILLSLFLTVFNSWGQVGSSTDALGGAAIGGSHALESAWTNPAALAEYVGTYLGGQYFSGPATKGVDLDQYSVTITDAATGYFAGAVGYRYRDYDVAGTALREHIFRYAAGLILNETLMVGGALYRVNSDPAVGKNITQDNGDLALYWRPASTLTLGAITRGVFGSKDNMFGPSKVLPSGGIGAEYDAWRFLKLRGDLNYAYEGNPDRLFSHHFGLELRHLEFIALRFGYSGDELRRENRVTAGIGLDGPRLRAGYSYQKEIRQEIGESHTVDIWLTF